MPCIDGNGKLTSSAKKLLNSIAVTAKTENEISKEIGLPLFKIRSSLREMGSLELVATTKESAYILTPKAKRLIED